MVACTFFGHRIITKPLENKLYSVIEELIIEKNVDTFYVGDKGAFDELVLKTLIKLKIKYSHIYYAVVLAYHPSKYKNVLNFSSIYPEELEGTFSKFAIDKRNRWMIEKSTYVITYIVKENSCADKYRRLAERKGLIVFNIAN